MFVHRSLAGVIGVFSLLSFFVESFVSGGAFCLVQNSGSLWDESGFAWSSVLIGSLGSLRMVVSRWFLSAFV